jgi:murein DD-endopeptidase MepM/ murein hydrolase activator NlpD
MEEQISGLRPNYLPALAFVGILIVFQNLAIHSASSPDPFLRPALSVTQAFRLPPEMQPAVISVASLIPPKASEEYREADLGPIDWEEDPVGDLLQTQEPPMIQAPAPNPRVQTIPLPQAAPSKPAPPPTTASISAAPRTASAPPLRYTIRRGDTLFGIAKRFDISVAQLKLSNSQLGNIRTLRPGMTLSLTTKRSLTHEVEAGESLWSISKLYGVSLGELITANSLAQQRIFVNQKLKIPTTHFTAEQFEVALHRQQNRGSSFLIPVNGRMTSHFGMRKHPILDRRILHRGLDIAAPQGTSIQASQKGIVTFAGKMAGYGMLLEIRHASGYTTRYGHCSALLKKRGDRVSRGDIVARVGHSGLATASHVHFEIRKDRVPQDPLKFL